MTGKRQVRIYTESQDENKKHSCFGFLYNRSVLNVLWVLGCLFSIGWMPLNAQELKLQSKMTSSVTISAMCISPDGNYLYTGDYTGLIQIWDLKSGQEVASTTIDPSRIEFIDFSRDSNLVVVWREPKDISNACIKIEPVKLKVIGKIKLPKSYGFAFRAGFYPDKNRLILSKYLQNNLYVLDMTSMKQILNVKEGSAWNSIKISLHGNIVESGLYQICVNDLDGKNSWDVLSRRFFPNQLAVSPNRLACDPLKNVFACSLIIIDSLGGRIASLKVFDIDARKEIFTLLQSRDDSIFISDIAYTPDGKYLLAYGQFYIGDKKCTAVKMWNARTGEFIKHFIDRHITAVDYMERNYYYRFTSSIVTSPDSKYFITTSTGLDNQIRLWQVEEGDEHDKVADKQNKNNFSTAAAPVIAVCISPDKRYIASVSADSVLSIWDCMTGRVKHTINIRHPQTGRTILFSNDNKYLLHVNLDSNNIGVLEIASGNWVRHFTGHTAMVNGISLSNDGKYLLSYGVYSDKNPYRARLFVKPSDDNGNCIKIWDYSSAQEVFSYKGRDADVLFAKFSMDGKYIYTFDERGRQCAVKYAFCKNQPLEILLLASDAGGPLPEISGDCKYIVYGSSTAIHFIEYKDKAKANNVQGHTEDITGFAENPVNHTIASCSRDKTIKIWNPGTKGLISSMEGHLQKVNCISYTSDGNFMVSGGEEGIIKLWEVKTGKEIASFFRLPRGNDGIVFSRDNYYLSTKKASAAISFVKDDKVYSFEQFDLKFNRPDIILSRMPVDSKTFTEPYYKAYKKRLAKMNFTEKMLNDDVHVPELSITNRKEIPISTDDEEIIIKLKALDNKYKIDRINLWLNDVPVFGIRGISLRDRRISVVEKEMPIKLVYGKNKIQVSVTNEFGVESLKEPITILCNSIRKKNDLYVVSIGVSEYFNKEYNLTYASKDAKDISSYMNQNRNKYNEIHILTITDKEATKENIMNAKNLLLKSHVNDDVILFYAGHGILDSLLDYYLATTDIDFSNPSLRGLSFEQLENIVDSIPAIHKLVMIDACHSGEVEKNEVLAVSAPDKNNGNVKSRGFKALIPKEKEIGKENSLELLKDLFADLRRGSGAVIISSASGMEFSYESQAWSNGVFTYAILDGLKSNQADLNGDGDIFISELGTFVTKRVTDLTKNQQNPTFRQDNLEFDFKIK